MTGVPGTAFRPLDGSVEDWARVVRLFQRVRTTITSGEHSGDVLWASGCPDVNPDLDARLWPDDRGEARALAMLHAPWSRLYLQADLAAPSLLEEAVSWALERWEQLDSEPAPQRALLTTAAEEDLARREILERHGFRRAGRDDVRLVLDLNRSLPEPSVPAGFELRALAGETEVEAYVEAHRAAWQSSRMSAQWHRNLRARPHFVPELNLVAVTTTGTIAGTAIGWLDDISRVGELEPLGVRPEYRQRGLARALVLELARWMKSFGAVELEVWGTNPSLGRMYRSFGFEPRGQAANYAFRAMLGTHELER